MAVNIPWGMAADFGVQQILPKNSFVDGYFQGQENTRQNNADARQQRISDWSLADRINSQDAGKLAAAGDYDGARVKLMSGGQLDAGFKLDENRHELMQRASKLGDHWSGLLSKAQTQEEWDFLMGEAKRNGAKLDQVFKPGEDWQMQQRRARVLSNYEAQQRAAEMAKADLELKRAQAATGKYTVIPKGADVLDNKSGQFVPGRPSAAATTVQGQKAAEELGKESVKQRIAAGDAMQAANALSGQMAQLRALSPNIISGAGAEAKLSVIRWGESLGVRLDDRTKARLSATELAQKIMTDQVISKAAPLKPLSNSDVAFVERATAGLSTSPEALPHVINAIERAAQRQAMSEQLKMQAWERQEYPDLIAIKQMVDERLPEYTIQMGIGTQRQTQSPTAQPQASPAQAPGPTVPPPGSRMVWSGNGTTLAPAPDSPQRQAPMLPPSIPQPMLPPVRRLPPNAPRGPGE